jgi:hypothetical protein
MSATRCLFVCIAISFAACGDNQQSQPDAPLGPPCSDGADNDGDGMIDFPEDLGCENEGDDTEDSPAAPACADNRDNDGDGKVDYPNDPGCPVPQIDDESDPCPGAGCPQCGDGKDNDGNGKTDFPDDTGCIAAGDNTEFTDDPTACGGGMVIKQLPVSGMDMGTLVGTTSNVASPCGGGSNNPAIAYVFHLSTPMVIVASTDDAMTAIDTILDLRTSMCSSPSSELACHDDVSSSVKKSSLTYSLQAGTYYLIVGGKTPSDTGMYALRVEFFPGEGTPCTSVDDCGPGLLCRIPVGQTAMVCSGPVCKDGVDDDGDGKTDYPLDPGCTSATDSTETDVCTTTPTDPACPACANGLDDDVDGSIDYPADTTCLAASGVGEACPQSETVIVATTAQTTGTTVGAVNDYTPPKGNFNGHLCSSSSTTHTAPDRAVQIDVPMMTSLSLRLSPVSYDSAQILFGSSCTGTVIECYDNPNNMVLTNVAAGRYYLVVDGYSTGSGTFTLNVSGTIANGESCESPLAQSGAITCGAGYACLGTAGSRTCRVTECNDAMDNNGDGRMDYPADPGCASTGDSIEDTVCPGPSCPACSDGLDNDLDMRIDYPTDTGCLSAAGLNEGCPESDPLVNITTPTTTGTLVGATDDHNPFCVTSNFPDRVYTLAIPVPLQSLVIDTEDSAVDTVLSLMNSTCTEPAIACDDEGGVGTNDSLIERFNVPAGLYTIAVDSDNATLDTYNLNVKGTIPPGGSCEGTLFQAGVLVCPPNFGCNGPMGSRTCSAAQCLDGMDNNGDGKIDFPNDPACTSSSDNTEDVVCPGATCPECGDGIDNDGDGRTDFPADAACASASEATEGCVDTDPIASILMPMTTGTLVGATNDHQPACVTSAGTDVIYTLTVPSLESLTIDTENSTVDTALSFMTSDCTEPSIACDDDGGVGTGDSLITRQFVQAGTYTIAIDADTTTPNTYILNVSGVISPGASCETPLFATGVLRCGLGFACDGPVGMRACVVAECIDGLDNNGDGRTDFPADPGCTSFSDDTEASMCPGPGCPVCGDGIDNDNDGATDYPADTSCQSASSSNEACTQSEGVAVITSQVTTGNTATAVDDVVPTCGTFSSHTAPDLTYQLDVPAMETLTLSFGGFSAVHTLYDATCGGTPIACSDPEIMTRMNVAASTYYVVVDGLTTGNGVFSLTTTGTVAPGGSCEGALFQDGAFTCSTGHACTGTIGSRTCTPALCNDGVDNDGDGKTDAMDPGCTATSDNDEADDCFPTVGANCPACSNGLDDDMDMLTDFPTDTRCVGPSFFVENFCPVEVMNVGGQIGTRSTAGTLVGAAANYSQTCQSTTGNDVAYGLKLPVPVTTLVIDTIGSQSPDTVVSLWNATCATQLGCDDDSDPASNRALLTVPNLAAGDYAIQVDAFGTGATNNAAFILNVRGTVAAGTACTDELFSTGVLACPPGTTCTAGTCQ